MPRILDVSVPLQTGLAVWPGDEPVSLTRVCSTAAGDPCNLTTCRFSAHVGTHVDPPFHFIAEGRRLDELRPEELVGPCWVADLTTRDSHLRPSDLEAAGIPETASRVLLKTRGSLFWSDPTAPMDPDYLALTPEAARWLVERGVRLVGTDALSVDPYGSTDYPAHHAILGADGIIVEGLDLREVEPGPYELLCLPLKLQAGDGAPARVLLRR